ncbi:hypothetical protein CVT26_003554 [Gymnopilus dilepis]|uniref:Uncharacterized protein n=1 Tax=Gymnopilus dilepis TaxID=231916 RepID=A0A409VS70_9AGAR|nr:hypothetical protein CVT26_003554 [Gymnopilus dilepis]
MPSTASEFDTLSDSDWLDIASGRDSDDNDSLLDQDSDRDEICSRPLSRRSSISTGDSMSSDVEAWEGFVSDAGDEAPEPVTGMYPVPLPSALGSEPIAIGFDPSAQQSIDPAVAEEDQRVKEALDQSFVGTLSASRSSNTGNSHSPSTHTSIRDLRLSFPDPLSSSRDELNRSYEAVSSPTVSPTSESSISASADDVDDVGVAVSETPAPVVASPLVEDPGLPTTPEVPHHEVEHLEDEEKGAELEIVLYGSPSEIKWKFVQELIQKAAVTSGYILDAHVRENETSQVLHLFKDPNNVASFFTVVKVHDRTAHSAKANIDDFEHSDRPSLAIVYLPTAKLPVLSWHDGYLPVLVPSITDLDSNVMLHAAEDDWELLGVPSSRVIQPGARQSVIFEPDELSLVSATQIIREIRRDNRKNTTPRPLTEQVKSVNAVTLFALMSIIMGFAFNTTFRPSSPSPTPTVNTPSSSNNALWAIFAQPNRSVVTPSTNAKACGSSGNAPESALKDVALSVFDPGSTSLSVTPPPASKSLSLTGGTSREISEVTTASPVMHCEQCASSSSSKSALSDKPRTSTDMVVRSTATSSLSEIYTMPSGSATASRTDSGSGSAILLGAAERLGVIPKSTVITAASAAAKLNSMSEVLDATTKAIADAVGTDLTELVEAADELLVNLREQTDNVIRQSKGKARAFGEQIQNIPNEFVRRNKRAKKRAQDLKEMGKDFVVGASKGLKDRTDKARKKARALKGTVLESGTEAAKVLQRTLAESEAWKTYEKAQGDWEGLLSRKPSKTVDKENDPGARYDGGGCWKDKHSRRWLRQQGRSRRMHVDNCL